MMYNDDFGWVLIGDGVLIGAPELKPGKLHETKPAFACFRQETPWNSPWDFCNFERRFGQVE